jgi:RNA polymerase sigma factor (sigma-70 family)
MKDYRLELTLRNNRILTRMKELGYYTAADLGRATGMSLTTILGLINMTAPAINKFNEWKPGALKLAEFLCAEPDDLWTGVQRKMALKRNKKEIEFAEEEISGFIEDNDKNNPEALAINNEMSERINEALTTLTPREEQVIRLRFGMKPYYREHTLDKVGEKLDITKERVRCIEAKALRKLKHPSRMKHIKQSAIDILG